MRPGQPASDSIADPASPRAARAAPVDGSTSWRALRRRLRRAALIGALEDPATLVPALAALFGVLLFWLFPGLAGVALVFLIGGTVVAAGAFAWRWHWRFDADFGARVHRSMVALEAAQRAGRAGALTTRWEALRDGLAARGADADVALADRIGTGYREVTSLADTWAIRSQRRHPALAPLLDRVFELALQAFEYRLNTQLLPEVCQDDCGSWPDRPGRAAEICDADPDHALDPIDRTLAATRAERRSVRDAVATRRRAAGVVTELIATALWSASAELACALSTPALSRPPGLEATLNGALARATALLGGQSPVETLQAALAAAASGEVLTHGGNQA